MKLFIFALSFSAGTQTPTMHIKPIHEYFHDKNSFTQGFIIHNGTITESTGLIGKSSIKRYDIGDTGFTENVPLEANIFAEGISAHHNSLFQLTWKNNLVHEYKFQELFRIKSFKWPKEGWGLTSNGKNLLLSDGSSFIFFIESKNFTIEKTLQITNNSVPVERINELEMVGNYLLANIWLSEKIAVINPLDGHVIEFWDAGLIMKDLHISKDTDHLNGIAFDQCTAKLYITGKRWPKIFEIALSDSIVFRELPKKKDC